MEYKYKQDNIRRTIARAIFDNKKRNRKNRMYYREIKSRVEELLHHPLSDIQLVKYLSKMVNENLLNTDDPSGRRGSKVYFSSTEKGMRKYGLKILGTDVQVQRRKRLYNLLIFFEVYKRMPLLTEKQLSAFLKVIGKSLSDLDKIQEITTPYRIPEVIYKSIKGVDIRRIPKYDPTTKINRVWYYVVIPGFSAKEFIKYQKLLKGAEEPRPFSSSRTIIPFAAHASYTRKEVKEAITSLEETGLIQPIEPVIPGESRYNTVDESLRDLVYNIWLVRMLDYEILTRRLLYNKPTDQDKKYLGIYFGESRADKVIAHAYDIRRSGRNEREEQEQAIRQLDGDRGILVRQISKKYEKVIQENEILRDIVEEICSASFYLPSTSN